MNLKTIQLFLILLLLSSCASEESSTKFIGKFNIEKDLFLAHFDCKTDVDDLHSVAGVATMLSNPRFTKVKYHAVAGAYGIQEGLYVPANELFDGAFGNNWSDAHLDFDKALTKVTTLVSETLAKNGNIWIADAGQSDFSAAVIRNIRDNYPSIETNRRINVVQHSDWNESVTDSINLNYVKSNSSYHKIPDGNATGNGTPGFRSSKNINWQNQISNPKLIKVWTTAIEIANKYNGKEGRYNNSAIAEGGLDFSDVSETCWIFGFGSIMDAEQFFEEFGSNSNE
ncbi:MAG: hypothetical protein K9J12_02650 [Melioribacteraceae bacterium]|nr:hypothetical protein [Melioribacteraceae bacterium]MCF8265735.1 hypothetical protein [Melioribacteraceae bacterium]MCF8432412.1 hypothetical protein [Melioribacteraceae bacterium]